MKITYLTQPTSRAGQRIPVQDIEDGEKFRVVSQSGQYLANVLADDTRDRPRCRFKRKGDKLLYLKQVESTWKWGVANDKYFIYENDSRNHPWMHNLRTGKATVIVEIY